MKILYTILALFICFSFWQITRIGQSVSLLKVEMAKDRQLLKERKSQLEEMRAHPVQTPDADQMRRLEQERRELIRLRGEFTRYTSTKGKSLEALEQEIAVTKAKAEAVWAESGLISKMEKAKEERKADRSVIHTLYHLLAFYEKQNSHAPKSIESALGWIESLPGKPAEKSMLQNISVRNEFRMLTWEDCELFDTGVRNDAGDPLKLLREKAPRCLPDDTVSRFYILENGRFREVIAPLQEFRAMEDSFLSAQTLQRP